MKFIIYTLLFFTLTLQAQSVIPAYPEVAYSELNFIAVEGDHIYTTGTCDITMTSEDGGVHWSTFESPDIFVDVKIVPNTNGEKAVFLSNNTVYQYSITTGEFQKISDTNLQLSAGKMIKVFLNSNKIFVISNNSIHSSTIGVYEWEKTTNLNLGSDYVQQADMTDNNIWLGTNAGKIINVDLSSNEFMITKEFGGRIKKIDMVDDQLGYVSVNGQSNILKTTNGGVQFFSLVNMPESISPTAYGSDIIMTINTNRIYVSTDGGASSTRYDTPKDGYASLIGGAFMDEGGQLYLVGRSNMIMKTTDFCQSFSHLNATYKRERLSDVFINEQGEGYVVGGISSYIHTTDNGLTWNPVTLDIPTESNYIESVISVDQSRFLIGHSKGISIVENGLVVNSVPGDCLRFMSIGSDFYAIRNVGSEYKISKSTDKGDSWVDLISLPSYTSDIQHSNTGKLYVPGNKGTLITSVDGGDNWEIEAIGGLDEVVIKGLSFYDDNLGLISAGNNLYLTTDGGVNTIAIANGYGISNPTIINRDHFVYIRSSGNGSSVYESTDGGASWKKTNTFCTQTQRAFYDGDKTVWLAQGGGHVFRHTIVDLSATDDMDAVSIPNVYPNPIQQGQHLFIEDIGGAFEKAIVYQIDTGKKIKADVNINSAYIDTKSCIPGFYLLELINDGRSKFTKFVVF